MKANNRRMAHFDDIALGHRATASFDYSSGRITTATLFKFD